MTLSYTTGLTFGSIMAYMLEACLGPPMSIKKLCPEPLPPSLVAHNITIHHLLSNLTKTLTTLPTTRSTLTTMATTWTSIEKVTKKVSGAMKKATKVPKIKTTATTLVSVFSTAYMTNAGFSDSVREVITSNVTTAIPHVVSNISNSFGDGRWSSYN